MKPQSLPGYLQLFILLLSCNSIFAQSPVKGHSPVKTESLATVEQKLVKHLDKINSLDDQHGPGAPDDLWETIESENNLLGEQLQKLTAEVPPSINYKFPHLVNAGMTIATSPDGLFRIYSWDQHAGGTAHAYNKVYQYKTGNKLYSKLEIDGNDESRYSKIHMLDINNKRYYLGVGHFKTGTLKEYASIQAFTIEQDALNDTVRIIRTQSGLTGTLGFEYSLTNDVPDGNLIQYDESTKTIRLPVVMDDGMITKSRITYKFTGEYFEKVK